AARRLPRLDAIGLVPAYLTLAQQSQALLRGNGAAVVEPLPLRVRVRLHQQAALRFGFDTFRHDLHTELACQAQDGTDHLRASRLDVGRGDHAAGDLQATDPIGAQIIERGVLRPEIV